MFENKSTMFSLLNSLLNDGDAIDVHTAPFERAKAGYIRKCTGIHVEPFNGCTYAAEFDQYTADKLADEFYDRDVILTRRAENVYSVTYMGKDNKLHTYFLDSESEIHCIYIA